MSEDISKMIDKVWYHSSNNKFELSNIILPAHFGTKQAAQDIGGKYLLKAKLSIKSPIKLYDNDVQEWNTFTVRGTLKYEYKFTEKEIEENEKKYGEVIGLVKLLESRGYDSIVYENQYEDIGNDSFIIFNKEQIIPVK